MPEEINRTLTDNLAAYLFIHSEEAATNLEREGIRTNASTSSGTR